MRLACGEEPCSKRSAGELPASSPEVSASGRATEGLGGGECRGPTASANGQILAGLLEIRFVDLSIEPIGDPDLAPNSRPIYVLAARFSLFSAQKIFQRSLACKLVKQRAPLFGRDFSCEELLPYFPELFEPFFVFRAELLL